MKKIRIIEEIINNYFLGVKNIEESDTFILKIMLLRLSVEELKSLNEYIGIILKNRWKRQNE